MPCSVDANGIPTISNTMEAQLRSQTCHLTWLQIADVSKAMVENYASNTKNHNKLKAKATEMFRDNPLKRGDELEFRLDSQTWRVRLVSYSGNKFSVESVSPRSVFEAKDHTALQSMIEELLRKHHHLESHEGVDLKDCHFEVFRDGQSLGDLDYPRDVYEKIIYRTLLDVTTRQEAETVSFPVARASYAVASD